jgi:hypothetical protein
MSREVIPAGPPRGNTRDIINAIARALPVAVSQVKERKVRLTGDPVRDAYNLTKYTRRRFTYERDGLQYQDIKLPSALEETKTGDCKSLSLYIAAYLTAAGYNNGLRFAAYGTKDPTHVYNYILDSSGKIHTFDACTPNLNEAPHYTSVQDMQTRIIAGVPVLSEIAEIGSRRERRRERRAERKEARQERREERREQGRGAFQVAKKITLAPGRGAFLLLVNSNFRGLATKLSRANTTRLQGFWGKLGGDKNKLMAAIAKGKDKKPVLGMNGPEIGSLAAAAATAAPIVIAATKLLQDLGIDAEDIRGAIKKIAPGAEPLGEFEAADPETPEAEALTKQTPGTMTPAKPVGFQINPFLIVGGLAAVYFLTRKKGR